MMADVATDLNRHKYVNILSGQIIKWMKFQKFVKVFFLILHQFQVNIICRYNNLISLILTRAKKGTLQLQVNYYLF